MNCSLKVIYCSSHCLVLSHGNFFAKYVTHTHIVYSAGYLLTIVSIPVGSSAGFLLRVHSYRIDRIDNRISIELMCRNVDIIDISLHHQKVAALVIVSHNTAMKSRQISFDADN